ncbi:hypothetical protein V490_03914 [Pseudogymnoascus sp. VKM F-3557]|nr:hypothetical protein V490_03914 [Pseudogymnoascus sp. VKM F-3557]
MIISGPTVSRALCKGPRPLHSRQVLGSFISQATAASRPYSGNAPASPLRGSHRDAAASSTSTHLGFQARPTLRKAGLQSQWQERAYATTGPKIVTTFEELPLSYTDMGGLPYYERPLAKKEIAGIFGREIDPAIADKVLRVLQGRRVAGTLKDPSLPRPHPQMDKVMKVTALKWLRRNIVVNEQQSAGKRAEIELAALGEDVSTRGAATKEFNPQSKSSANSKSVLEAVREAKEKEWQEKVAKRDALRAQRMAEMAQNPGGLVTHDDRGVELRRPGENELLKHYTALAAKVVPETPPDYSTFKRLWPSALVTLAVIAGCVVYSGSYTPPKAADRMFKDIPPAIATIAPIIAFNAFICLAWHHPPAWRVLNKYFLSVPGYPRALAVLGNAFSHQSFKHLAINMAFIYMMGTQLHDQIGRGNFLAIYFGTAVTASFASLAFHVVTKRFMVSSLGASGALNGVIAATLFLNWNNNMRLFGILPPEPYSGPTGGWWLAGLIVYELWSLKRKNIRPSLSELVLAVLRQYSDTHSERTALATMSHPFKANPDDSQDNPGSSSKWRHQESSKYARRAAGTGGNPPHGEVRAADEHTGTGDLTNFLNTTRMEGTGQPLSETGHAPASGVPYKPITANSYGQFDDANERVATANAPPPTGLSGGQPAAGHTQVRVESTDGKEVRCGPLLNYRRMEGSTWFGSVLVVVQGGVTEQAHEAWVPELLLKKIGPQRPVTEAGTSDQIYSSAHGQASQYDTAINSSVHGELLYADMRHRFWRFNIALEMEEFEAHWAYQIPLLRFPSEGKTDHQSFFVPSINESMRIMFHSCNGFSVGTDEDAWSGPALWNDVQRVHGQTPFHVMIGGGDQIYNDGIRVHGPLRPWTDISNPKRRRDFPFPESLRKECDDYYVNNYVRWYSTEPFAGANGQIPQLNLWDDHDIIDGFGSYVSDFMQCDVFRGIGGTAYKYYLLFQHHLAPPVSTYTTDAPQTMANDGSGVGLDPTQMRNTFVKQNDPQDPSYLIGRQPGPYVAEHSRNIITRLGARIAFFGLDARTERTRHQVNYPETYQMIFDRISSELATAAASESPIKHLVVLLGIPIAYPRLTWLENILSSPLMAPIKFFNKRFGLAGGFINKFDGGVDLVDDLDDHYTARTHKAERLQLVKMLQDISGTYGVRVTILSGDVHLAAVGRFYANPKLGIPVEQDPTYMANVVSSAIVNKPPPSAVANLLAHQNKIHHLDKETDETLLSIFDREPGPGQKKAASNKVTMPSRNWTMITECSASTARINTAVNTTSPVHVDGVIDHEFLTAPTSHTMISGGAHERPQSAQPAGAAVARNTKRGKVDKKAGFSPLGQGEVEAGTTNRAADPLVHGYSGDGALDVAIRVEKDQHDPSGQTQSYGFYIPTLNTGRAIPTIPVIRDWASAFGGRRSRLSIGTSRATSRMGNSRPGTAN